MKLERVQNLTPQKRAFIKGAFARAEELSHRYNLPKAWFVAGIVGVANALTTGFAVVKGGGPIQIAQSILGNQLEMFGDLILELNEDSIDASQINELMHNLCEVTVPLMAEHMGIEAAVGIGRSKAEAIADVLMRRNASRTVN